MFEKAKVYNELVSNTFPANKILPGYTLEDIIRAGIKANQDKLIELLEPEKVFTLIVNALENQRSFSLIRLGDGEAFTLAQGLSKTVAELKEIDFLEYAGLKVPDYQARDRLVESIKMANLVGVPTSLLPNFLPLLYEGFKLNKININKLVLTSATINYTLHSLNYWPKILNIKGIKVAIAGNKADLLAKVLKDYCQISGIVPKFAGVADLDRVLAKLNKYQFDLLLVPAGIAAAIICPIAAKKFNCVAFDLGHLANQIIKHPDEINAQTD